MCNGITMVILTDSPIFSTSPLVVPEYQRELRLCLRIFEDSGYDFSQLYDYSRSNKWNIGKHRAIRFLPQTMIVICHDCCHCFDIY